MLGAVTGTIASGPLCDRTGRRSTLVLSSVLFLLGGALMTWSPGVRVLIGGRLVSGVATGLVSTAVPQYIVQLLLHPTPVVGTRMLGRVCVGAHTKDESAPLVLE